jgi:hypothetical protein
MNFDELYKELVINFGLTGLPDAEKEEMLTEIAKTIQKQFLFDVYDALGQKDFEALQASAQMGEEFYSTTLKHLLPNYEEVFQKSKQKVITTFKNS